MKKKNVITILFGIVLLGSFLRLYGLGSTSFVADEFLDLNSSYAYAKTGQWQSWDFNFGKVNENNVFSARDSRAWVYKWPVAQVFKYAGVSEAKARIVSALWGIATIALIYFYAVYFTGKKEIGLMAAFLFAVSISGIIFDRRLRMYAMFIPVFLAFSWATFRFLEEEYLGKIKAFGFFWKKWGVNFLWFFPAVIFGVLSFLVHDLTGNIVFILLAYSLVGNFLFRSGVKKKFLENKYLLILSGMLAAFALGMIFIPKKISVYTAGIKFFSSHWAYFGKAFSDYADPWLAVLFLGAGSYYLYGKKDLQKKAIWLGVSFSALLLAAVFLWNRLVGDQYILFLLPFTIILISSGIYGAADFFSRNLSQFGRKASIIPILVSLFLLPNYAYFFQSDNTYRQTSQSESPDYGKIFSYFSKNVQPGEVLVSRNFRNYYWKGKEVKVFDFGGELSKDKFSLDNLEKIISENPRGWLIISENDEDYVSNGVLEYAAKNMEKVSNIYVRGNVSVYRWGKL